MRPALALATLLLALGHALPVRAADGPGCRIDLGPDDRLAQGEDLVVPGGVEVRVAFQFGKGLGKRLLEELGAEGCEVVARANAD
jgi:hypothetical protein